MQGSQFPTFSAKNEGKIITKKEFDVRISFDF